MRTYLDLGAAVHVALEEARVDEAVIRFVGDGQRLIAANRQQRCNVGRGGRALAVLSIIIASIIVVAVVRRRSNEIGRVVARHVLHARLDATQETTTISGGTSRQHGHARQLRIGRDIGRGGGSCAFTYCV